MQLTEGYRLTALRNAQQFLTEHAHELSGVAQTGAARRLDSILDELSCFITEQAAATMLARSATARVHQLRQLLLEDHLTLITRIARAALVGHPDVVAFQIPRRSTPVERLAAAARGMASAAEAHAAVFVSAGLPEDFLARLGAAVDELLGAYTARAAWRARLRSATVGINTRLADGQRTVAVLDSFIRAATRNRRELQDGWLLLRTAPDLPGRRRSRSSGSEDIPVPRLTATATLLAEDSESDALLQHEQPLLLPGSIPHAGSMVPRQLSAPEAG